MENIIRNIKVGGSSGFDRARSIADKHQEKTGNVCIVRRILDYTDIFNDAPRNHYSLDIVEIDRARVLSSLDRFATSRSLWSARSTDLISCK